jgi:hypothetical protein
MSATAKGRDMETAIDWKKTVWCAWDRETLSYVVSNDGTTWVAISEEMHNEKFVVTRTTTNEESLALDLMNNNNNKGA